MYARISEDAVDIPQRLKILPWPNNPNDWTHSPHTQFSKGVVLHITTAVVTAMFSTILVHIANGYKKQSHITMAVNTTLYNEKELIKPVCLSYWLK
jgi:hypothetical protein